MYTVKDVSKMLDLSEHTIRYYTNEGLVPSLQRDENVRRLFDEETVAWVNGIVCMRKTGMGIKDLKHYVSLWNKGDSTLKERYEIIVAQQKIVEQEMIEMQEKLNYISNKINIYKKKLSEYNNKQ